MNTEENKYVRQQASLPRIHADVTVVTKYTYLRLYNLPFCSTGVRFVGLEGHQRPVNLADPRLVRLHVTFGSLLADVDNELEAILPGKSWEKNT